MWCTICAWDARPKLRIRGTRRDSIRRDTIVLLAAPIPWWKRAGNATRKTYTSSGETIAILELLSSECGNDGIERFWRPRKLTTVKSERVIAASRQKLSSALSPVCELTEPRMLRREVKAAVRDGDNWPSALGDFACPFQIVNE
jgi:hypothetical protein